MISMWLIDGPTYAHLLRSYSECGSSILPYSTGLSPSDFAHKHVVNWWQHCIKGHPFLGFPQTHALHR